MMTYVQKSHENFLEMIPRQTPIGSVIWLHGLGADGHDFVPIVTEFDFPDSLPLRFIFPHAPLRPVTLNNGHVMRAWFDLHSLDFGQNIDYPGIEASIQSLQQYIEAEKRTSLPTNKIILAGFSQGATIALLAGLYAKEPLGGIMALSGCLPMISDAIKPSNVPLPIFMGHGTEDDIVPISLGLKTAEDLQKLGFPVDWHVYDMSHTVCQEEVDAMKQWLFSIFNVPFA